MMVEAQADWKSRLEDTQHRYEQMGDWRVNKLQEYYEQQLKRKRHCADNDSEEENTTMQDIDAEVACLQEKLLVSDELLKASQKECSELSSKYSKLMFELAQCKLSLKNSEKLKEAAQAACEGDRSVLIKELESQLAAMREELCKKQDKIQELDGILEDAQVDCRQLEDDLKATEKERDDLDLKLVEKESDLGHSLDALSDKQRILDKQLLSLDEKDEHIEILEKKLKELHEKYDSDMKTMTTKTEELEERLKTSLMDNKLLKSEEENNTENVHTLQSEVRELKNKLKESEEKLLQAEAMEQTHQKEIENLNHINNELEDKLSALEKAEKTAIKEMISAQNCAEEHRKLLEENTLTSQKEISKLKTQLQSCMDNAEFVRLLKEELEGKSFKFEQLENENECLKKSLEVKEVEMVHFKENRDSLLKAYENMLKKEKEDTERYKREVQRYQQMFLKNTPTPNKSEYEMKIRKLNEDLEKKNQELKGCYVKLVKLGEKYKCGNQHEVQSNESQSTALSDSKDVNRQRTRTRTRTKAVDENTQPPLTSSEKKYASRTQSNSVGRKQGCNEKTKSRSRRKNLFSCNLDESSEITPVETEEIPPSMSPTRILRSHRR
ncbi:hypothetical protein B7P43_G12025 [Cryptotermes secundus]|uniref:Uncharacterized protein n=3 Tax=Cryptotermes secundus TaxID=105785 RepID=A0A2J7RD90_9NEOP|nr:hypothetical protein B7P43_G12025 [Cryptotermes secundus]